MSFIYSYIFRKKKNNTINEMSIPLTTKLSDTIEKNEDRDTKTVTSAKITKVKSEDAVTKSKSDSKSKVITPSSTTSISNKPKVSPKKVKQPLSKLNINTKSITTTVTTSGFNDANKENEPNNDTYSVNTNYTFVTANTSLKSISTNSMVDSSSSLKKNVSKNRMKQSLSTKRKSNNDIPKIPKTSPRQTSSNGRITPEGLRSRPSINELKEKYNIPINNKSSKKTDYMKEILQKTDESLLVSPIKETKKLIALSPKLIKGGTLTAVGALLAENNTNSTRLVGLSPIPLKYNDDDDNASMNNSFDTTWNEYHHQYDNEEQIYECDNVDSSFSSRQGLFYDDECGESRYDFDPIIEIEHQGYSDVNANLSYVSGITSCNTYYEHDTNPSDPIISNSIPRQTTYSNGTDKKKKNKNEVDTKSKDVLLLKFIKILQEQKQDDITIINGYTEKDREMLLNYYTSVLDNNDPQLSYDMIHSIQFMLSIIENSTIIQEKRDISINEKDLVTIDTFTSPSNSTTTSITTYTPSIGKKSNYESLAIIAENNDHHQNNKDGDLSTFTSPSSSTSTPTTSNLSSITSFSFSTPNKDDKQTILHIVKEFSFINGTILSVVNNDNEYYNDLLWNVLFYLKDNYLELLKMKRRTISMLLQQYHYNDNLGGNKLNKIYESEDKIAEQKRVKPKRQHHDVITLLKQQKLTINSTNENNVLRSNLVNNHNDEYRDGIENTIITHQAEYTSSTTDNINHINNNKMQGFHQLRSHITEIKRIVNWKPHKTKQNLNMLLRHEDNDDDDEINEDNCLDYYLLNDDNDVTNDGVIDSSNIAGEVSIDDGDDIVEENSDDNTTISIDGVKRIPIQNSITNDSNEIGEVTE